MRERTIASHYARAALGGARRAGYDYSGLLQQVGITPELLSEPRARIAPEQFTRLLQIDRKSTRLNSSHVRKSRMPSSA